MSLHTAAKTGDLERVKLLVEQGADIEKKGYFYRTPLFIASWNGHLPVVRYLVEQGAEKEVVDMNGFTPLITASYHGHVAVVSFLLEQGVDKDKADRYDRTTLFWTVVHKGNANVQLEVAMLLVAYGADMDKANEWGQSPLLYATMNGHFELARYLLEQGANRNIANNNNGSTPLHYAALYSNLEIVTLLMLYGADLNARLQDGRLPIDVTTSEEIKQAIRDEPRRRMDEAPGKRAIEHDRYLNVATFAQQGDEEEVDVKKLLAAGEVADEDQDSESSSDEDDN